MVATTVDADLDRQAETEYERVLAWRAECLRAAGYPYVAALELAVHGDVDLHAACTLLAGGCDPLLAVDILI
jgi:hypothetical protein